MKSLARAVANAALFLELSGDDVVDPDAAVAALEDMGATLERCTPAERAALRDALAELAAEEQAGPARDEVRQFYLSFMKNFDLDAPAPRQGRTRKRAKSKPRKPSKPPKPAPAAPAKQFWNAIERRDTAAAAKLLKRDPALANLAGKLGITALHWAAQAGDHAMVRLLLDHGADVRAADEDGDTALHWSALDKSADYQSTARLLIARGADLTAKNKKGQTPRQKAAAFGKNPVLLRARK